MVIGYLRVSSEKQDLQQQEHLLLKYAQQQEIHIDEFIKVEISSRRKTEERRINELMKRFGEGYVLLVTEQLLCRKQNATSSPCARSKGLLPREHAARRLGAPKEAETKKEPLIRTVNRSENTYK